MRIDRLVKDDFADENHVLLVENDVDQIEFVISIDNGRSCRETQNPGRGEDGFCTTSDTNNDRFSDNDKVAGKY